MSHTPTPWSIESNELVTIYADDDCDLHPIASTAGNPTCRMLDEQEANAEYIVRCVNAHDELVAALKAVMQMHCMPTAEGFTYRDNIGAMAKARAALAKAAA